MVSEMCDEGSMSKSSMNDCDFRLPEIAATKVIQPTIVSSAPDPPKRGETGDSGNYDCSGPTGQDTLTQCNGSKDECQYNEPEYNVVPEYISPQKDPWPQQITGNVGIQDRYLKQVFHLHPNFQNFKDNGPQPGNQLDVLCL